MVLKNLKIFNLYIFNTLFNFIFQSISIYYIYITCFFFKLNFLCYFLFKHLNFQLKCFIDLLAVDFLFSKYNRFLCIYNVLSIVYNIRLLFKIWVPNSLKLNSLIKIYYNIEWYEREVWDLYGIFFYKNIFLRRILNDYNFKWFPFRKDFPSNGFIELRYIYKYKSLNYASAIFIQEYRNFKTISAWDYLK